MYIGPLFIKVLAWDLWKKLSSPLFRLQGHRSPILRVVCAAGKGRAVSLDENGKIMLWDTRKYAHVNVSERWQNHNTLHTHAHTHIHTYMHTYICIHTYAHITGFRDNNG